MKKNLHKLKLVVDNDNKMVHIEYIFRQAIKPTL